MFRAWVTLDHQEHRVFFLSEQVFVFTTLPF